MPMTTSDCIVIEGSVFQSLRASSILSPNERILNRIAQLLDTYECFNEAAPPHTQAIPVHPSKFHGQKFGGYQKRFDHGGGRRRTHATAHRTRPITHERQITSLLNKITKDNYGKMSVCIKELTFSNERCLSLVLNEILCKCQRQVCFLQTYMLLLRDIHSAAPDGAKGTINDYLRNHVLHVTDNSRLDSFKLQTPNYDDFCRNLNNKSEIIGKHKTAIALLGSYPQIVNAANGSLGKYFDEIFKHTIDVGESNGRNTDLHELLLEMLWDFIRLDVMWKEKITKYFAGAHRMDTFSPKARFQVMDIMQ